MKKKLGKRVLPITTKSERKPTLVGSVFLSACVGVCVRERERDSVKAWSRAIFNWLRQPDRGRSIDSEAEAARVTVNVCVWVSACVCIQGDCDTVPLQL